MLLQTMDTGPFNCKATCHIAGFQASVSLSAEVFNLLMTSRVKLVWSYGIWRLSPIDGSPGPLRLTQWVACAISSCRLFADEESYDYRAKGRSASRSPLVRCSR